VPLVSPVCIGRSEKARSLARRCNEFAAELVHTRPDPFAGFACIPLRDIDASVEELSYAVDVLRLDGLVLFTNSRGVYLGDATLEPVLEELERRKPVVFVHPNPSPDAAAHSLGLLFVENRRTFVPADDHLTPTRLLCEKYDITSLSSSPTRHSLLGSGSRKLIPA